MSRNGAALGLAALLAVASLAAAAPASATPGGGSNPHGGRSQCELAPGRSTITVQSGGLDRTVVVHVPTTGKRSAALPLVLDLHGSNSTPTEQLTRSQLDKTAEQEGFIVAAPQGAIPLPAGFSWNVPFTATDVAGAPDDVTFLADLIATLTDDGCVDASRVYAAGYSGGGRLVSQFACEHPELVAAIAPVAGLRAGAALTTAAGLVPDPATCAPRKGVPVITFNGTADPTNPFDGGGAPYWGYGALAASERWAEINGCKTAKETRVSASVTVVTHRGCKQHAAVLQYVVAGGGHTWPGGNAAAFPNSGVTTQEISASNLMWNFFERYKSHRH
ncbi:extracellular catalytic domain type 1 short-chain-length polyhydroxyalkanoate depolymerase [Glaciihabitans tibetensis]|nr:PHB depolymerase family esterase [Glaciihabitans tibetensis]